MKGYKVFNYNWVYRDFKYEVGKTYEMKEKPKCCEVGFHFCKNLVDCFRYYSFDPDNKKLQKWKQSVILVIQRMTLNVLQIKYQL